LFFDFSRLDSIKEFLAFMALSKYEGRKDGSPWDSSEGVHARKER